MKTESGTKPTQAYIIEHKFVIFNDLDSVVEIKREDETIYQYNSYQLKVEGNELYIRENLEMLKQSAIEGEYDMLDKEAKEKRKRLLEETDNYCLVDRPEPSDEMKSYRQHLRDITEQENYPYEIDWGVKPQ